MHSCLYRCKVMHQRMRPKRHRFCYHLFMFYIDLDEINRLTKLFLISHNCFNYYSFCDRDHLQEGALHTKENIIRYVRKHGIEPCRIGKVFLFTQLRILNYTFNPVSFYFVYDKAQHPICAVAEVANTFNEQKLYFLSGTFFNGKRFQAKMKKYFYISPFSPLDLDLAFDLRPPQEQVDLMVNECDGDGILFTSSVSGKRLNLNNKNLFYLSLRYPLLSLMVIIRIHWQAARLWLKKLPFYAKAESPELQQDVRVYLRKKPSERLRE